MVGIFSFKEYEGQSCDLSKVNLFSRSDAYLDEEIDNTQNDDQNVHESELSPDWGTPLFSSPGAPDYEEPDNIEHFNNNQQDLDLRGG